MPFQLKENSGVLFKNEDKEKETHADYNGEAFIDGVTYWMNAWLKTGKSGKKFMSFSFRPKTQKQDEPRPKGGFDDMKEDIPF